MNLLIWTAHFTEDHFSLLPRIKEQGFDGVELPLFNPDGYPAAAVRKALEGNGLEATTCCILPSNSLFDEDAANRRKALEHVKKQIAVNAEIGSSMMAGPVYSPVGWLPGRRRTADEWARAIDSYGELTGVLDEHGVTLAIEPLNRFETFFLNTAADGAALCDAVNHSRVGLLIDTFHSNIEEKDVADAYRVAGRHLKHVHTCENDRGIPGSGHVEWPAVFDALRGMGYDGWLTIESFGFNIPEISGAAAIWRDLAPTPESIAFDGLKFLKRRWGMT
ncbi:MAG TPA: sugar phosphate isomerase/epimerase family protein [Bryobacteraceae bacterium]|nr:sugar phosphate isomerase/epimerase family protein [Bryobacteraceae bacterium]